LCCWRRRCGRPLGPDLTAASAAAGAAGVAAAVAAADAAKEGLALEIRRRTACTVRGGERGGGVYCATALLPATLCGPFDGLIIFFGSEGPRADTALGGGRRPRPELVCRGSGGSPIADWCYSLLELSPLRRLLAAPTGDATLSCGGAVVLVSGHPRVHAAAIPTRFRRLHRWGCWRLRCQLQPAAAGRLDARPLAHGRGSAAGAPPRHGRHADCLGGLQ